MFGCDDVVFTKRFDVQSVAKAFSDEPRLLGFSLRLGLDITYGAMARTPVPRPRLIRSDRLLVWSRHGGAVGDWAYPFELNGTIYRKSLFAELLRLMDKESHIHPAWRGRNDVDWGHPNRLEATGSYLLEHVEEFDLMAAFPKSVCKVVTVNRVQEV